jgi:hypothetical protein
MMINNMVIWDVKFHNEGYKNSKKLLYFVNILSAEQSQLWHNLKKQYVTKIRSFKKCQQKMFS